MRCSESRQGRSPLDVQFSSERRRFLWPFGHPLSRRSTAPAEFDPAWLVAAQSHGSHISRDMLIGQVTPSLFVFILFIYVHHHADSGSLRMYDYDRCIINTELIHILNIHAHPVLGWFNSLSIHGTHLKVVGCSSHRRHKYKLKLP